jgi:hypothetical protein
VVFLQLEALLRALFAFVFVAVFQGRILVRLFEPQKQNAVGKTGQLQLPIWKAAQTRIPGLD